MCAVEWKKLGDVCYLQNGFAFKSNKFKEEGLGIVRITNIKDSILDLSSLVYFEKSDYPNQILKQYEIHKGDILIAMSGATTGKIGCSLSDETLYLNQRVGKFIPCEELDNRYLYHLLKKDEEFFYQLAGGGAQPNLSSIKLMDSYCFYLPSLAKQQEIVSHLDTFTTLISNLESELDMRRNQYEHYRNQLLDFEGVEGVEWKTLGDVGNVCMCKRIMKEETSEQGDIPFFKIGTFGGKADAYISNELYEKYKKEYSFPKKGDILISASGTIGRLVVFDGKDAYFQDSNIVWIDNDENLVYNAYLKYYYQIVEWKTDGGTIKRLYNNNLRATRIAIPSKQTQQEIVEKLDAFENLIQSLEQEIKLRKQQYEYYREKLLTFEKE